jgi:hypothetical protein
MANTSNEFPPLEVSVTSRFYTYRLMYYIRELLEIIADGEPSCRKVDLKALTDELHSFESKTSVLQMVSAFVLAILAFDGKSNCPKQTSLNEDCLKKLAEHAEFWFDCLGINSPPQLYYCLDNLQDDINEIEKEIESAKIKEYKIVYKVARNLAKKVYDILSILLASEE